MIWTVLYILIAAIAVFVLIVGATKYTEWDTRYDVPWPVLCGIVWPVGLPIAAAYIAAKWYISYTEGDTFRRSGIRLPVLWTVAGEDQRFVHIRCWLTGEHRVIRK